MKLRIKGNSLRLRISRSEMAKLAEGGNIEDTIHFAPATDAKLTYALRIAAEGSDVSMEYLPQRVTVVLSTQAATRWATSDEVGIYGTSDTSAGPLELIVEKDFACLDGDEPADEDAFPNPNSGTAC
jgi:hypothetical protein